MGFHIPTDALIVVWSVVIATVLLMAFFTKLYRKAGPNEALVVYGIRGPRIIKGHGTIILPMVENCRELSLELMSFDVAPQQDLYTRQGVAVTVEADLHGQRCDRDQAGRRERAATSKLAAQRMRCVGQSVAWSSDSVARCGADAGDPTRGRGTFEWTDCPAGSRAG